MSRVDRILSCAVYMVYIILEVDPLWDDLAGQPRHEVIPGVASKLQREARHAQAPSMEKQLEVHVSLLLRNPQGLSMRAAPWCPVDRLR
jgi:hypothetical protein